MVKKISKKEAKYISDVETFKKHLHKWHRDPEGFLRKIPKEDAEGYFRSNLENADRFVDEENEKIRKENGEEDEENTDEAIPTYSHKQIESSQKQFKHINLLNNILQEISKDHLEDDNLKMTLFLTYVTALLKNPKRRMSFQLTGKTSDGKDNAQHSCLKHLPRNSFIFITSGTEATLQDDIKDYRIIAISELNLFKEFGANKGLLEIIKQRTEGGSTAIKKDLRKNNKSLRLEKGEQGCVTFGTTDIEQDEELGTRLMKGTIKATPSRIRKVNENTLNIFSDEERLIKQGEEKDSWIRVGLSEFFNQKIQYEIVIPYAKYLSEEIDGEPIFDNNDSRSQRDIKRLLSLTCAVTYLFQNQREKKEVKGVQFLISEPQDFLNALKFSNEFFNQSYLGRDSRLDKVLNFIKKQKTEWIARDDMQKELNVSRNTIKEWCRVLADEGCLKGISGKELNDLECRKIYDGNRIYYQRCQKGVKKPLIRCQISKLKGFLESKTKKQIDTFFSPCNSVDKEGVNKKVSISEQQDTKVKKQQKNAENNAILGKIDTLKLTPLCKSKEIINIEDFEND